MTDTTVIDADTMVRPTHTDSCEAEAGHAADCATATRLARLVAFAEAVRDEFSCNDLNTAAEEHGPDDCWHCYATQALALEPVR